MKQIYCLNNISTIGLSALPSTYQVTKNLEASDAILVRSAVMHDMLLPNTVKAVARAGAGVNNIPLDVYGKKGIVVFNTPGANANAVKELMIAGMLLASRDIYGGMKWLEANKHDEQIAKTVEKEKANYGGTEIFNKTVGIVGLGAIGILFANACSALGMKVVASGRSLASLEAKRSSLPKDIVLVETKEEVYKVADFISLNLPLDASTKGMINHEAIALMKDGVVILNFARDSLVNDEDLRTALDSRKVKSYVTDFPNSKTVNMNHVIAIPHLGASTEEAEDNCATMAVNQIVAFLEEGTIINSVNYPNMELGPRKMTNRICILHDAAVNVSSQIINVLDQAHGILSKTNQTFGYTVIETNAYNQAKFDQEINKIDGIYRILYL
ncbi:MAG TPA: 3-phosphoglycerate dehydrogenase family protein [Bacilli bacterium]|nr:3-phosphoglycerate dehydrogenase family protein [Bacilli bacterium]